MSCNWQGCTRADSRPFMVGPRCPDHTPAAVAGRPDIAPDPALTLEALREKAGTEYRFRASDTSLIDDRAVASGRRRFKNAAQYRLAQQEEARRKAERK